MLTSVEQKVFMPFMMVALLCNCAWRFMNFNIDHREIEACRDTYVELQDRIKGLDSHDLRSAIQQVLTECFK